MNAKKKTNAEKYSGSYFQISYIVTEKSPVIMQQNNREIFALACRLLSEYYLKEKIYGVKVRKTLFLYLISIFVLKNSSFGLM